MAPVAHHKKALERPLKRLIKGALLPPKVESAWKHGKSIRNWDYVEVPWSICNNCQY